MSVDSVATRAAAGSEEGRSAPPARWEIGFAALTLLLATGGVVPLVFNPDVGATPSAVGDPVSKPLWVLVALLVGVLALRHAGEILEAAGRNPAIAALCVLALASVAWSVAPGMTLQHALWLVLSTVFGLYLGVRFGTGRIVTVVAWVTLAILVLSAVLALALPRYGLDHVRGDHWRGVFTTKNELGRVMVVGAIAWATRALTGETGRVRGTLAVAAFALAGFESDSRTAWAAAVVVGAVLWFAVLTPPRGSAWVPLNGFAFSLLILAGVFFVVDRASLLRLVGADSTLTGRSGIWHAVWSAILAKPWLGYGFDGFWRGAEEPSLAVWRLSGTQVAEAHNGYLDLLLDLGVVGLAVFLVAFAVVLGRAGQALHRRTGSARIFPLVFAGLFLVYNVAESSLVDQRSLLWIVFVAVAAAPLHVAAPSTRFRRVRHVSFEPLHEQSP